MKRSSQCENFSRPTAADGNSTLISFIMGGFVGHKSSPNIHLHLNHQSPWSPMSLFIPVVTPRRMHYKLSNTYIHQCLVADSTSVCACKLPHSQISSLILQCYLTIHKNLWKNCACPSDALQSRLGMLFYTPLGSRDANNNLVFDLLS